MRSKLSVTVIAISALVGATSFAAAQNAPGASPATPSTQQDKPGMAKGMEKGPMNNGTPGTSGMGSGGTRPDPSGQGGAGPGSDQGGTRVTPGNMK